MKRTERAEMLRLMADELAESTKNYENAMLEHNGHVCVGYGITASDTKTAISRKIVHMRQALIDLEGKL